MRCSMAQAHTLRHATTPASWPRWLCKHNDRSSTSQPDPLRACPSQRDALRRAARLGWLLRARASTLPLADMVPADVLPTAPR